MLTAYNYGAGFIDPVEFVTSEILPAVLSGRSARAGSPPETQNVAPGGATFEEPGVPR